MPAPRRSAGNYRLYSPDALDRVQLIRRALAVGFSLAELAKILKVRDEGGAPCRQVKRMLEEKVANMNEQISDLTAMRDHLRTVLKDWGERLDRTPDGRPARLLETLAPLAARPRVKAFLAFAVFLMAGALYAQPTPVESRGDHAMGFSHEKTAHHFRLLSDGGAIEVEANDPSDAASKEEVRAHLSHIVGMFSAGNFEMPMFIHDQVPPGVPEMKRLKDQISYRFENTDRGGRVRIVSQNKDAVKAVHRFLRFQIADHHTGDSGRIESLD